MAMPAALRAGTAAAGRHGGGHSPPRRLSRQQLADTRKLLLLAKDVGVQSVRVLGATFFLLLDGEAVPSAPHHPAAPAAAADASVGAREVVPRRMQRRKERSQLRSQRNKEHMRYKACRLRPILVRACKMLRWQRMQAVWTAWMRDAAPAVAPMRSAALPERTAAFSKRHGAKPPLRHTGLLDSLEPDGACAVAPATTAATATTAMARLRSATWPARPTRPCLPPSPQKRGRQPLSPEEAAPVIATAIVAVPMATLAMASPAKKTRPIGADPLRCQSCCRPAQCRLKKRYFERRAGEPGGYAPPAHLPAFACLECVPDTKIGGFARPYQRI